MNDARRYRYRSWTLGRLVIGAGGQAASAPVIDGCRIDSEACWTAGGICIRLQRTPGRALHIGWIGGRTPRPGRFARMPLLGRLLFRMRH